MNLMSLFRRRRTATVARERLQILLAYERSGRGQADTDLLSVLHKEIMEVIARHVKVETEHVLVTMDRGDIVSTLEIDVEIPNAGRDPVAIAVTAKSAPPVESANAAAAH